MAKTETKRYRLSVPISDEVVLAWLSVQDNMSASMRAIIKDAVRKHGLCDVFSSTLPDGTPVTQQPVPVATKTFARSPKKSQTSSKSAKKLDAQKPAVPAASGIQLAGDAMSDFGIELGLGDIAQDRDVEGMDLREMMRNA